MPEYVRSLGWVVALIGLIVSVVLGLIGRLDILHAVLFALAFLVRMLP